MPRIFGQAFLRFLFSGVNTSAFAEYAGIQDLRLKYRKMNGNSVCIGNVEECRKSCLMFFYAKSVQSIFSSFIKHLKI